MKNACLSCGVPIFGRIDKKFCTDHCRNYYHNERMKHRENVVREINKILTKNRTILEKLLRKKASKIGRSELKLRGFDFRFYTGRYENPDGSSVIYCYDKGYTVTEENHVSLVSKSYIMP